MGLFKVENLFSNGILPSFRSNGSSSATNAEDGRKTQKSEDNVELSREVSGNSAKESRISHLSAGLADAYGESKADSSPRLKDKKPGTAGDVRHEIQDAVRRNQIEQFERQRKGQQKMMDMIKK